MEQIEYEKKLRDYLIGNGSPDTYDKNYLIEAGAGAGKTYTMVNRIIKQLMLGKIQPDQLVAITFTEKATQEMLGRIDTELLKLIKKAKDNGETEHSEKLLQLLDNTALMQVSTIHAFCNRLLRTMPFESDLGPEFELLEDTEAKAYASDFFEQYLKNDDSAFKRLRAFTGMSYDTIKEAFLQLCDNTSELKYEKLTDDEINAELAKAKSIASDICDEVVENGSDDNVVNKESATVQKIIDKIEEVLRLKDEGEEFLTATLLEGCNPLYYAKINADAIARVLPGKIKANTDKTKEKTKKISAYWCHVIHALSMELIDKLIADFRLQKKLDGVASQNDLLYYARNLLRDHPDARNYFHDRFKTIYVDEMQDTDPIQAQILFYLTADEKSYKYSLEKGDWAECCPVPGSLFLVGDPKQAIYRFRGADISIYNKLLKLFTRAENPIGVKEELCFNYRSTKEICDFADEAFKDVMMPTEYQAAYQSMHAVHGASDVSHIVSYKLSSTVAAAKTPEDAEKVAGFIKSMVDNKTKVGNADDVHEAQYSDFMILVKKKALAESYVNALAKLGIPSNMAAEKSLTKVEPLQRALRIFSYLMDLADETKLALVLQYCYDVPLTLMRSYKQRVKKLCCPVAKVKKALCGNKAEAEEFMPVLLALEELQEFADSVKTKQAYTVMEDILTGAYGVWHGEKAETRTGDYSAICQFLKLVRSNGSLNFYELVPLALAQAEQPAERELLLEADSNCVRIFNLHKAKGLESEVIILASGTAFGTDCSHYTEYSMNDATTHYCLTKKTTYGSSIIAQEKDWADYAEIEEQFKEAENLRLLYVAATRAKSMLVVCYSDKGRGKSKGTWDDIINPCTPAADIDIPGMKVLTGEVVIGAEEKAEVESVAFDKNILKDNLNTDVQALCNISSMSSYPSELEHNLRGELLRNLEEENAAQGKPKDTEQNINIPHGADWGTVIHRTMELAVKLHVVDTARMEACARQAVLETIGNDALPLYKLRLLTGNPDLTDKSSVVEIVTKQVVAKTAFAADECSPWRKLVSDSHCYTELPFSIHEDNTRSELYRLVAAFKGDTTGRPLDMNGAIDLAISNGKTWTIIDYKTDIKAGKETDAELEKRLIEQYHLQLKAYKEILNKLGLGEVVKIYICSIELNGKLIEVE